MALKWSMRLSLRGAENGNKWLKSGTTYLGVEWTEFVSQNSVDVEVAEPLEYVARGCDTSLVAYSATWLSSV